MNRKKNDRKSEPQKLMHIRLPESTQQFIKNESNRYGITVNSFLKQFIVDLQDNRKRQEQRKAKKYQLINALIEKKR